MTRRTMSDPGVVPPLDDQTCAGSVDPAIPVGIASNAGAGHFSLFPLTSVRILGDSSPEIALTPTSPEAGPSSVHRENSLLSSDTPWINPFIVTDKANMPPDFNVNHLPPFLDPLESLGVQRYDVVKLRNVPFTVTIAEIKSLISRLTSSPLIKAHIQGYPIHIVMERPTGKTMDCYVEFQNQGAGRAAVHRAEQIQFEGKMLKIGSRWIEIEASCEGELCAALFPRAKSVNWDRNTGIPEIIINQDPYSEGFQGFFTVEEMASVCKHAANPQKSTFNQRCQQRVYESMISTMYKFPWHVPQHYSVNARDLLWSTYMELLHNLAARVLPTDIRSPYGVLDKEVGLSHNLLMDYVFAGLNVQMFSLRQKLMIIQASGPIGAGINMPQQASYWPFQALMPPFNCPTEVLAQWLYTLDVGYEKCLALGITHGYEDYMQMGRDDSNYLKVKLNDAGRAMTFANLISMEKILMRMLIEQGRKELCKAHGIPYRPVDWSGQASTSVENSPFWNIGGAIERSRFAKQDGFHTSDEEIEERGARRPHSSDRQVFPDEDGKGKGKMSLQLWDESTAVAQSRPSAFNPTTPSFIPSQPWTSGNIAARKGTSQPASAFKQTDTAPYDPFSGDVVSSVPRRSSFEPTLRHTSEAFGNVGVSGTSSSKVSGNASVHVGAQGLGSMFDSIWSHPQGTSLALPAIGTPSQGTLSVGSGSVLQTKSTSISTTSNSVSPADISPSNADAVDMQFRALNLGTPSRAGDGQSAANDLSRIWTVGSPNRGLRDRSSTSRNAFRIQATIHEESDVDMNEAADEVDNAAGGVSLQG